MARSIFVLILLALLAALPAAGQTGRRERRQSAGRGGTQDQSTTEKALPEFAGIVRGLDKKMLLLEEADQNTMQLYCTKKTQYFDGEKKIKASEIKVGDRVSVEARLGPDGKPEAVHIRLERDKPAPGSGSPQ